MYFFDHYPILDRGGRVRGISVKKMKLERMVSDLSFGIDFKPSHLILTLLKKSLRRIVLADYEIHPLLPDGQREEREVQILNLINTFISRYHLHQEKTSISVPREKAIVRLITLPIATKENLRKVIEYEISRYTPFEREEVYFDYQIVKEEKERLHLFTVFIKKTELDPYLSLLKKIGIEPISIQIPSVGALNLFYYHEGTREGEISVLLDVTGPFFEMNLIQGRDWKESFHLPLPQEGKELRMLNTFKRSGLEEDSSSKSTFFVYGLDADETLLANLKQTNHLKGVSLPPLNRIEVEKKGASAIYQAYASIGVPLQGLTRPRVNLNLLPFEMKKKVRQIGKTVSTILTSLAFFLFLAWGVGIYFQYRSELEVTNAEIKKRKPEVEAVEKLQKQNERLGKTILELQRIKSEETSKIEILREITQLLPVGTWIWNFRYNGKEIEISGFTDSASDLIPLLDKSPLFEKVEFLTPVTKERAVDREKERFKIKAKIEGRK